MRYRMMMAAGVASLDDCALSIYTTVVSRAAPERGILDGPGMKNVDLQISRDFRTARKTTLQVRVVATNAFNFVNFGNPEMRITQSNFGRITSAGRMRQVQLGAKLSF